MLKRQERSIEQVIKLRAGVDEARRRVEVGVFYAVRMQGVPVRVLAERLGMTRSRVYQLLHNGEALVDYKPE